MTGRLTPLFILVLLAPEGDPRSPSSLVGVVQDSEDEEGQGEVDVILDGDILWEGLPECVVFVLPLEIKSK